ncbi:MULTISPECIES: head-tail connector protein [unclassified Mesorhizobium]|uniref:head-tail connector protein n=1 Tax=unclassified Mesorhizobium TaxID=325217 RepID=UPI0030151259
MTLFRTVDPAVEPVTLTAVKSHLRLSHDTEDELLSGLIKAAREDVERATGVAMISQSWRLAMDRWPPSGRVVLARYPVQEILSVTVFGSEGEASLVDPADYQVDTLSRPARIHFERRPEPMRAMNGIEIDFSAGFGEAGTDVPDLLKRAVTMLVAHWYEFRASYGAADQPVSYPAGYDRLIAGYRERRL